MIIAGTGVEEGQLDLAPTILDSAGSAEPDGMDSVSLKPILTGQTEAVGEVAVSALSAKDHPGAHWRMAADRTYKLIEWENGRLELYSSDDRFETDNLSDSQPEILATLRADLPPMYAGYGFEND